jgi:H2-forming N5,N10-methylenetetrahydromethanopterin dehydrogenase-like enzyme
MTDYRNTETNEVFTISERVANLIDLVNSKGQHVYVSNSELVAQYEITVSVNDPFAINFYR